MQRLDIVVEWTTWLATDDHIISMKGAARRRVSGKARGPHLAAEPVAAPVPAGEGKGGKERTSEATMRALNSGVAGWDLSGAASQGITGVGHCVRRRRVLVIVLNVWCSASP